MCWDPRTKSGAGAQWAKSAGDKQRWGQGRRWQQQKQRGVGPGFSLKPIIWQGTGCRVWRETWGSLHSFLSTFSQWNLEVIGCAACGCLPRSSPILTSYSLECFCIIVNVHCRTYWMYFDNFHNTKLCMIPDLYHFPFHYVSSFITLSVKITSNSLLPRIFTIL